MKTFLIGCAALITIGVIVGNQPQPDRIAMVQIERCPESALRSDMATVNDFAEAWRNGTGPMLVISVGEAMKAQGATDAEVHHHFSLGTVAAEAVQQHLSGSEVHDRVDAVCSKFYYGSTKRS